MKIIILAKKNNKIIYFFHPENKIIYFKAIIISNKILNTPASEQLILAMNNCSFGENSEKRTCFKLKLIDVT